MTTVGRVDEPVAVKVEARVAGDHPWALWRQPVRTRHGLGALLLGRQDMERLTCDQRHRAQILRIELEGQPSDRLTEGIVRSIAPIMALATSALRFSDLEALEKAVFALRSAYEVEQCLPALRNRLALVDPNFDLSFLDRKGERWDESELRAAAKYAITMVYERECGDIVHARKRYDLLRFTGNTAFVLALTYVYLVTGRVNHDMFDESGHLLACTMVVGGLGGIMSSFVTLGNVKNVRGLSREAANTRTLKFSVLVHLIGGFVFSMVMFMLLLGGFLQGSILPDMKVIGKVISISGGKDPFPLDFFTLDMAKLTVWAFISGYIGGLIPSQLSKIGRGVATNDSKPAPPVA